MGTLKKNDSDSLTKRHFASLHSRIQNKYEQMQKRLEKSKSFDSITALNEDFVFVQTDKDADSTSQHSEMYVSADDKKPLPKFNVIIEDVKGYDSSVQDVIEPYSYSETPSETEKNIEKFFDNHHESLLSASLES